jgi:restriction endonuclease S subunit
MSSGAVISFIPLTSLRELLIPVPSISAQQNIVNDFDVLKQKARDAEQTYKAANDELVNKLRSFKLGEGNL